MIARPPSELSTELSAFVATHFADRGSNPDRLIAGAEKAGRILGWRPRYPELRDIVSTAWSWHQQHPDGYAS